MYILRLNIWGSSMELLILDKNYQDIGTLDIFNSMQWIRKYYDYSEFQLDCGIDYFTLLENGEYLFRKGYELMIIESIQFQRRSNNKYTLNVRGRSVTSFLEDRVVWGENSYSGTHESIARQLVDFYWINTNDPYRVVDNMNLGIESGLGESTSVEIKNKNVGGSLFDMLKEAELSQIIEFDYLSNQLYYKVWKGADRTEEQDVNSWASFSDDYDNMGNVEYSVDKTDYKNFSYIIGKNNVSTYVNQVPEGGRRRECVVTSSDTDTVLLKDKGKQELVKYKIVELVDCEILKNENLQYLEDFDLGDMCTVKINKVNKIATMRITEIHEIYENGEITILPKFGEDYVTIQKYVEREVSK